jgi:hypothetical protein
MCALTYMYIAYLCICIHVHAHVHAHAHVHVHSNAVSHILWLTIMTMNNVIERPQIPVNLIVVATHNMYHHTQCNYVYICDVHSSIPHSIPRLRRLIFVPVVRLHRIRRGGEWVWLVTTSTTSARLKTLSVRPTSSTT